MSFWKNLAKPIFVLAPMADVTDPAFRRVIAKYGKPDVTWTEFVSADGLVLAPEEGRKKLLADLQFSEAERPIVAQFFTGTPANMEKACALALEMGFDGVDINMGCPDKSIEKQKAGAAMMKGPARAKEVIAGAIRGAGGLPVSVKTRIGYNKDELGTWVPHLLETGISALTLHLRTRKEMSAVPAHWDALTRAVALRDKLNPAVLILGNGDAKDIPDAKAKVAETGADGVMLGRAIFGNPWLFAQENRSPRVRDSVATESLSPRPAGLRSPSDTDFPSLSQKLLVMVEHTKLFEELLPHKNFAIMKKHYKAYVRDFEGSAELRAELMNAPDSGQVEAIVHSWLHKIGK